MSSTPPRRQPRRSRSASPGRSKPDPFNLKDYYDAEEARDRKGQSSVPRRSKSNDADRNTEDSDTEDRFDLQSVLKDLPKVVWATFRVTNGVPAYLQGDEPIIFGNGQAPCDVVLRYPRIFPVHLLIQNLAFARVAHGCIVKVRISVPGGKAKVTVNGDTIEPDSFLDVDIHDPRGLKIYFGSRNSSVLYEATLTPVIPGLSYIYEVVRSFTTHTVNGDIMYEAVRHPLAAEDSSATPSANATTFLVKAEKAAFDRLGKGESIRWILNNTQAGVLRCLHGARQSSEDSCPALQHIPVHLEDNLLWRAGARGSDWIVCVMEMVPGGPLSAETSLALVRHPRALRKLFRVLVTTLETLLRLRVAPTTITPDRIFIRGSTADDIDFVLVDLEGVKWSMPGNYVKLSSWSEAVSSFVCPEWIRSKAEDLHASSTARTLATFGIGVTILSVSLPTTVLASFKVFTQGSTKAAIEATVSTVYPDPRDEDTKIDADDLQNALTKCVQPDFRYRVGGSSGQSLETFMGDYYFRGRTHDDYVTARLLNEDLVAVREVPANRIPRHLRDSARLRHRQEVSSETEQPQPKRSKTKP